MVITLEVPSTLYPTIIQRIGSEVSPSLRNGLAGLLREEHRVLNPDKPTLTRAELNEQFDAYEDAARQRRASMFIATIAYNMIDDQELGGFSQVSFDENKRRLHVEHLLVTAPARRAHVGKLLLNSVVQEAYFRKAEYVQYDHKPHTLAEEKLFQTHNFTENTEGMLELPISR